MKIFFESLKYFDCFGITFDFYTEKSRKFYTPFGGLFTILSILGGIIYFICVERDDFLHNTPISTTSESKINNTKIKFLEEKIWIPWRIRDYNSRTLNFTNLFYPIVYYYRGIYNKTRKALDLTYSILNYSLCSETSMAKNKDFYSIDIDLEKIYCIEMDNIEMGGNWDTDYVFYVQFDLYICKNGIDYDENNSNCSSYEKIIESAGEDNSYSFDVFYPVVHYQPFVKEKPIFVKYDNYFYHLSRFSNKIDRIFLQKYQLNDDNGWIMKQENITTHWGYVSISGDTYMTGDKKDLVNEGSSSRIFSFNIYVNSDVVYYSRSYKKLLLIIANGLPNINLIFTIFKAITKIYVISLRKKKFTEFLFENIEKKPNVFEINKIKKINEDKNYNNINLKMNKRNINGITKNNIDNTSLNLYSPFDEQNKGLNDVINKKNSSFNHYSDNNILNKRTIKKNYENLKIKNSTNELLSVNNKYKQSPKVNLTKIIKNISNKDIPKYKPFYIHKKLFPFKYYLCSVFFENIGITKKSIIFDWKFVAVCDFMCQIFDVTSYLILQREFNILKSLFLFKKYKTFIENKQKVNINDSLFNIDIKECLRSNTYLIPQVK